MIQDVNCIGILLSIYELCIYLYYSISGDCDMAPKTVKTMRVFE